MNTSIMSSRWSTASRGATTDISAAELAALRAHLELCRTAGGRLAALGGVVHAVNGLVIGRLVTTLVLVSSLVAIALHFV